MKKLLLSALLAGSLLQSTAQDYLTQEEKEVMQLLNHYEQIKVTAQKNPEPLTGLGDTDIKQIFLLANNTYKRDAQNYMGNALKNFVKDFLPDSIKLYSPGYLDYASLVGSVIKLDTPEKKENFEFNAMPDAYSKDIYILYVMQETSRDTAFMVFEFAAKNTKEPNLGMLTFMYQDEHNIEQRLQTWYSGTVINSDQALKDTTNFIEKSNSLYQIITDIYE
jgi:hypothetical protein